VGWKDFESKVKDVRGAAKGAPDRALLRRQSEMESPAQTDRMDEDDRQ